MPEGAQRGPVWLLCVTLCLAIQLCSPTREPCFGFWGGGGSLWGLLMAPSAVAWARRLPTACTHKNQPSPGWT